MNSTKKNSEFGGVKKKLTAAIAMLLVATIMMVSSTYAWFTLSTAPEVTGITTSVGANGNLEMALLNGVAKTATGADGSKNTYEDMSRITSNVGDSTKPAAERNITWGNLVDLTSGYGLDTVKLNPARLNVTGTADKGYTVAASQLLIPQYGNDGRVSTLVENIVSGIYAESKFTAKSGDDAEYGVRALGTASGMNGRQIGYRNAVAEAATYASTARNEGAKTISANGNALAQMLVNHYTNGTDQFDEDDLRAILSMANGLKTALSNVDLAMRQYLIAEVATKATDDAEFSGAKSAIENTDTKLSTLLNTYVGKVPTGLDIVVAAVEADLDVLGNGTDSGLIADVTAKIAEGGEYNWSTVNGFLSKVANTDSENIKINGLSLKGSSKDDLINKVIEDSFKVTVTMGDGSGLFANVAKYAGNYQANLTVTDIQAGSLKATLPTTIVASYSGSQSLLKSVTVSAAPSNSGEGANNTITDTYGYIVDLAVRTNAASAKLQLSEAKQRIYNGSDNADTMGSGSTMSFKTSEGFGDAQVKALMAEIRVVFLDGTGKVLGVAALDMDNATLDAEKGWTAPLHLYEYTFAQAETVNNAAVKCGALTLVTEDKEVDGKTVKTLKRVANDALCDLTQNTPTKISALVYLDGDSVDNSDVANAAQSMTGSMNLQFSTDVELKPMDYTPLKNGTANP